MSNSIATDIAVQDTEKYSSPGSTKSLQSEKRRLYKAAKDMESLFMYQILKAMRSTVPKAEDDGKIGLGDGMGKDVYTQLFDQKLATMMSGKSDRSIADVIYRSMEKALEREYSARDGKPVELKNILPTRNYLKIKNKTTEIPVRTIRPKKTIDTRDSLSEYDGIINHVAVKYKLKPSLLKSIIQAESAGNPKAVSSTGAKGLMQLTDTTAADLGINDIFNPHENIEGGAKYLRQMIDRFGNIEKALAAYNAGPSTVARYGDIPPYPETLRYVRTVMQGLDEETPYY
jgi:Rod binding domain-containing protein